jgi:hypothetical protein
LIVLRTVLATIALVLCLGLAVGSPRLDTLKTTLRAVGSVSVSKYTESGVTRYDLWYDDLGYGQWYNVYPPVDGHEHAALLFDLSAIPDTAHMEACELGFFQHSDDTAGTPPYELRAYDYVGQEPESLFAAVENGALVAPEREAHYGWNRVPLDDTGVGWVQARLLGNSLQVAIKEDAWGELGYAYGSTDPETLRPYLLLSYLPTAVEERSTPDAARPTLEITPNPCHLSTVVHLTTGPLDHSTTLVIYDASGRIALSQPIRFSPFTLHTSLLSSGVYVARCTSGCSVALARLTVRHR